MQKQEFVEKIDALMDGFYSGITGECRICHGGISVMYRDIHGELDDIDEDKHNLLEPEEEKDWEMYIEAIHKDNCPVASMKKIVDAFAESIT